MRDVAGADVGQRAHREGVAARGAAAPPRVLRHTKLDLVRYYLAVADGALRGAGGRPNVLVRYPNGVGGDFFYQKRAPESRPDWIEVGRAAFPSGRTPRRSCRATRPRSPGWPTSPASSCTRTRCAPTTSTTPTSCASTSIPVPGVEWPQIREVARSCGDARRLGLGRLAEDVRLARHARQRAHRAALDVRPRCAAPRWRFAREVERRAPDARHEQVVEGGAPRRLPRLQPERQGPHRRLAYSVRPTTGRARLGAARPGTRSPTATPPTSRWRRCRRASRDRRPARRHRRAPGSLEALLELSARQEAEGSATRRGRRTTASRRASRRACSRLEAPRSVEARCRSKPADRDRRARARRRTRSPGSSAGRRGIPRPPRTSQPADVLVDAMRGRFTTWTRIRVNLQNVPEALRRPPEAARTRTSARRPGRPRAEHLLQLVGRRDLELIVAAVLAGGLSGRQRRKSRVAEAVALQWSYFTSHTRSMRSGSHDRSLPALQRLCPPGMRVPLARAALGPLAPRVASSAFLRSGASSRASCLRALAIVNDDVTPTWCSTPPSS
jgi:bifunctional non-homologous end joining protein LigD